MSNNPNDADLILSYQATATIYIPIISNITPNEMIQKELSKHKRLTINPIIPTYSLYNNENFTLIASINDTIEIDHGYLNEPETIPTLIKSDIINKYGYEDIIDVDEFDIDWRIIN